MRALVEFAPKPSSSERLCAGVVSRLSTGEVSYDCAIDPRKAEQAFGIAGIGLWHAARALCESLAGHWQRHGDSRGWISPFEGAKLGAVQSFSARSQQAGNLQLLRRMSTLLTLFDDYELQQQERSSSIVQKVRSAIRKDVNAKHLQARFQREIHVGERAGKLKVDFLGQNFACYFLQITHSERGVEATAERAYSRLYELQALKRFVARPAKSMGLLEDERPSRFELVMIGSQTDPVQRSAINLVTALADRDEVRARPLPTPEAAAEHVTAMERLAA
jgi:hypothetical protein